MIENIKLTEDIVKELMLKSKSIDDYLMNIRLYITIFHKLDNVSFIDFFRLSRNYYFDKTPNYLLSGYFSKSKMILIEIIDTSNNVECYVTDLFFNDFKKLETKIYENYYLARNLFRRYGIINSNNEFDMLYHNNDKLYGFFKKYNYSFRNILFLSKLDRNLVCCN